MSGELHSPQKLQLSHNQAIRLRMEDKAAGLDGYWNMEHTADHATVLRTAVYTIYTSPDHVSIPDHLPTLVSHHRSVVLL